MKQLNNIAEFNSSPEVKEKLVQYGIVKTFAEGDVILNENAYIKAIPIVRSGSIRVMRTDEDGREILLYYIKAGESCIMSFLGGKGFQYKYGDCSCKKLISYKHAGSAHFSISK